MTVKQYRFVSPGVFVNEIDNSKVPAPPEGIGPLVIGRSERGPSMRPVEVNSFSEFIDAFGNTVPGGIGGDVWRGGNRTSPMYAGYAAQAYLANKTPLTFLRLLGYHHEDRTAGSVEAGWTAGLAYGLFVAPVDGVGITTATDGALAAIVYAPDADTEIGLVGTSPDGTEFTSPRVGQWVLSQGTDYEFVLSLEASGGGSTKTIPFNFARTSKKFIRRKLNTNPTLTNSAITETDARQLYWLGETFEPHLDKVVGSTGAGAAEGDCVAMLVPLIDEGGSTTVFDKSDLQMEASSATSSWVISQHTEEHNTFQFNKETLELPGVKKLFRFVGINDGEWSSKKLKLGFSDIKASDDEFRPYGSFTVIVRVTSDSDNAPEYVERYTNCNLNPNSPDYIARRIGDMDSTWSYSESRYRMTGNFPNRSRFVRVEMDPDVDAAVTDAELLPFGFYGPAAPRPVIVSGGADDTGTSGTLGTIATDDAGAVTAGLATATPAADPSAAPVGTQGAGSPSNDSWKFYYDGTAIKFRLLWPAFACRNSSTTGNLSNGTRSYFGITSNQANGVKEEPSYPDFVRPYSTSLKDGNSIIDGTGAQQAMPQLQSDGAFGGDCFVGLINQTITTADKTTNVTNQTFELDVGTTAPVTLTATAGGNWTPGGTLAESLDNLVELINGFDFGNGAGNDVCATVEELSTAYKVTLSGISDDACDDLTIDTGSTVISSLSWVATANTCIADAVKLAAGDYFGNGIVTYFSLDDLVMQDVSSGGTKTKSRQHVDWRPGSRFAGASVTVRGTSQQEYDAAKCLTGLKPGTYRDILEHGYDQFAMPIIGGFDGLDITEKDPFRNTLLGNETELTHYAFNSIKRAIDTVADPEVLDMNLASVPGVTNSTLTTHLTEVCRDRGDCLAVIDLENDYVPRHEGVIDEFNRLPNVEQAVVALKERRINNSYGTAYFPWVQTRDTTSGAVLWMPPSVVALGTMAFSETRPGSELWFAPAGFNRGGLSGGAGGIPVTNVRYRLTSKERDQLYEANINPIASFPNEGIVVFGNKTLQVTPSALDRVNVRRLMIFIKKEVSRIANDILFDQNVEVTWNRFTSRVEPLLGSIKSRFGLTDFKVVLDETTTTPDLVDRNIVYAKIFLKPAQAIEFIAIDFNITRTGASFAD